MLVRLSIFCLSCMASALYREKKKCRRYFIKWKRAENHCFEMAASIRQSREELRLWMAESRRLRGLIGSVTVASRPE